MTKEAQIFEPPFVYLKGAAMQRAIRTRFAPSPTGYMHLGNIWIAF